METPATQPTGTIKRDDWMANKRELWKHAGELAGSSAFLLYLADAAPDRLSVSQAAFFMLAAAADARGTPLTRAQIADAAGERLGSSVLSSYRVFLTPSRLYPNAVGWLQKEDNPDDERESLLILTPKGREVIEAALLAMKPLGKANA